MLINVALLRETEEKWESDLILSYFIELPEGVSVDEYGATLNREFRESLKDSLSPAFSSKNPDFATNNDFFGFWIEVSPMPSATEHSDFIRMATNETRNSLGSSNEEIEDAIEHFVNGN